MSILAKKKTMLCKLFLKIKQTKTSNETCGGGTTKKLAQRRKIAKVFERFLNKSSVPLRLRENLLKKLRGLAASLKKKRSREKNPHGNANF